ncbi:MAG: M28 family peptidase [Ignavibacteria bacterium]|nr:M28 family peptidase [Ignavibacteria bacterium]
MKHLMSLRIAALLIVSSVALSQPVRTPDITIDELRHHLRYLASDELEGRRAGSKGADLAAEYIGKEFKAYGLKPAGDKGSYFQEFEFVSGVELGKKNVFAAGAGKEKHAFTLGADFRPLGFSSTGSFKGGVIFAGYGITATEKQYDDYAGIDVKEKAVIFLRYHPEGDNQHSEFNQFAAYRYKATKARELGAKLIIVVTGPADSDKDELLRLSYDNTIGNAGILAVSMTRASLDKLLQSSGTTVKQLQEEINTVKKPKSFNLSNVTLDVALEVHEVRMKTKNVIGYLEGSDPALKDEIVVVGAHYDHLGMGGEGSGSLKPDTIAVHNGADDNGSGTVGMLELAQHFSAKRGELKRSMMFMAFAGEELGLLGSANFVKNPTIDLSKVAVMINMDMIGRMSERKLIVYGIGTSPGFKDLVNSHNSDSAFVLKLNPDGFGPSDHASFYGKNIPVFHFFTDLHGDYHRPSDDEPLINYDGLAQVLRYVGAIAADLNQQSAKPSYVQVEAPRPAGGGRGVRAYTGTIPDFGEQSEGMKISGVREGSPAAKAGLQGGDVIIKFGKVDIKNLYDYTFALGEYNIGDEVDIVVKRGNEVLTFKIVLERRN